NSNDKNRCMTWKTLNFDVVLVIETFGFRICFEFRISNFEFPDKLKINWLKNPVWFRLVRVMGGR
ncbi:MAG: hypothetical protein WBB70_02500, partial [Desulfobacterales bacterium]